MADPPPARSVSLTQDLRWWIAGLIFPATLIDFLNRLTLAEPSPVIAAQFRLTGAQLASLTDWFLVAYSFSRALSGKLYDRIGNKRGFAAYTPIPIVAALMPLPAAITLFTLGGPIRRISFENI